MPHLRSAVPPLSAAPETIDRHEAVIVDTAGSDNLCGPCSYADAMSPSPLHRYAVTTAVVVGLLLVVSPTIGLGLPTAVSSVDTAATPAQPTSDDDLALPERLEPVSIDADGTTEVRPDAGAAIRKDSIAVQGTYQQYLLDERLQRSDGEAEQTQILQSTVDEANETTRNLRERERTVRARYEAGTITEEQFVRELALLGARAETETDKLSEIHDEASRLAVPNVRPRAEAYTAQLQVRQGDVRSTAAASVVTDRSPTTVYVATGSDGTVLATVDGLRYDREANRDDVHVATDEWGVDSDRAWELKDELYPRFTDRYGFTSISGSMTQRHMYRASGSYEHGDLVSYIDAHSETAVREDQSIRLGPSTPTHAPLNGTNESVTVSVERTYASGPARVTVLEDGEPVEGAPIEIGGDPTGLTNANGEHWVLLPYDDPEVGTVVDGQRASVTVQW